MSIVDFPAVDKPAVIEPLPMPTMPRPPRVIRRQLVQSQLAGELAAVIQRADEALGLPKGARPNDYQQMAEVVIGRLDPLLFAVAMHTAAGRLLDFWAELGTGPNMTYKQRKDAMRRSLAFALPVFEMVLDGRLPASPEAQAAMRGGL